MNTLNNVATKLASSIGPKAIFRNIVSRYGLKILKSLSDEDQAYAYYLYTEDGVDACADYVVKKYMENKNNQ